MTELSLRHVVAYLILTAMIAAAILLWRWMTAERRRLRSGDHPVRFDLVGGDHAAY